MTIEELQVLITANTDSLRKEIQNTQKQITSMQKVANNTSNAMLKSFNFLKTGIIALGIGKLIGSQMDDAVSRLDTLNNFPKVMSNLGIGSKDATASLNRMSDALLGLPTTLDAGAMAVQRFTSANGNVKASTEMFLALNNAILAGGADMQVQSTALEQLSQSYAKGKPDMMEWRSAMTAMPAQLKQVAIAMGYASADQLGESLRNGKTSMNEFMIKLVELNKTGANGFKSFDEQARNSTGGVKTSLINLKTTFARAIADIMNAIGQSNIAGFFNMIKNAIVNATPYITGFVKACVWAVSTISSLFGGKKSAKKAIDDTKESLGNLGSSGVSTASDIDKTTGSAKKLNKELHGLASFDEMNVLKENDDSSGGSGSGSGAGGDLGALDLSAFDMDLDNTANKADKIAERIKKAFSSIGDFIKKAWESKPVQAFVDFATTYGKFLYNFWSTLGNDFINNTIMTWGNIHENVETALSNISTLCTDFFTDLANGIDTWGQPIINGVSNLFNSIWKDAIDPALQLITKVWADFTGILVKKWNEYGKPLINNIGEFATKTIELFQKIWDDVLEPIITPFLETLSWLWDKHLKGLVEELYDFIGKLVNGALEIYNKFIQPVVMNLIDKLAPAWSYISSLIIGVLGSIIATISDVVKGVLKVLGGLIDFITGVFTGNWKKAWNGIKSIFKGVFDGLVGIFKLPINLIIDGLNAFISGINKVKIPDWVPVVGGKGFSIPKIPKLASGGIVEDPTLAMIGEKGKEVVLPIERNTGWIDQLADKLGDKVSGSENPIQFVVKIGEDTVFDKIIDGVNKKNFETNGEVFNV